MKQYLIAVFLLLTIWLGGCEWNQSNPELNTPEVINTHEEIPAEVIIEEEEEFVYQTGAILEWSGLIYRNEEYGFEIRLPQEYGRMKIEEYYRNNILSSIQIYLFVYDYIKDNNHKEDTYVHMAELKLMTFLEYDKERKEACIIFGDPNDHECIKHTGLFGHFLWEHNNWYFSMNMGNWSTLEGENCCLDRSIISEILYSFKFI